MTSRKAQILAAVDDCLTEYKLWMDDNAIQHIPVGHRLDAAIGAAVAMCEAGDVPTECRQLIDGVMRLAVEYDRYHGGEFVPRTKSPKQRFHSAVEAVARARGGSEQPAPRKMESVKELRRQGLSDSQIAVCFARFNEPAGIYVGIFHDNKGRVLHDLIQQEYEKPGAIIPVDWMHPNEAADRQRAEADYANQFTRLTKLRDEDTQTSGKEWTEADVVSYLREGAFVHQVVHVYGITQQQVIEIANRNGIDIDPKQPGIEKDVRLEESDAAKLTDDQFRKRVYELSDEGTAAPDIVKTLRHEFQDPSIKVQRVNQLLLHRNKEGSSVKTAI